MISPHANNPTTNFVNYYQLLQLPWVANVEHQLTWICIDNPDHTKNSFCHCILSPQPTIIGIWANLWILVGLRLIFQLCPTLALIDCVATFPSNIYEGGSLFAGNQSRIEEKDKQQLRKSDFEENFWKKASASKQFRKVDASCSALCSRVSLRGEG